MTAFVHVVDCRAGRRRLGGRRAPIARARGPGNLYIQYWTYYADSATLRDVPIAGEEGFHRGRLGGGPDPHRARRRGRRAGLLPQRLQLRPQRRQLGLGRRHRPAHATLAEALGARAANGWGPETRLLLVSGGSHAGNATGIPHVDRFTPGRRVHLIPLEPIAATDRSTFAITPPWLKKVWRDPEASGTD